MNKIIKTPHDLFVKASLSEIAIATDFFKTHLPKHLQRHVDFRTLRPTAKEFVLPHLRKIESDVIYECKIDDKEGYLYCLVEHQSTPDKLMAFRLLKYIVALMDHHLQQGNKKLPVILPLCIYHGKDSPYPHSNDILDCFESPDLAKDIVFKPFKIIDLTVTIDEELKEHGRAALMELLLKNHADKQIVKYLNSISELLRQAISSVKDDNYVLSVLEYISNANKGNRDKADSLLEVFTKTLPDKEQKIMTFAQQLKEQGMRQREHDLVKNMLEKGLDDKLIREIATLKTRELDNIKKDLDNKN